MLMTWETSKVIEKLKELLSADQFEYGQKLCALADHAWHLKGTPLALATFPFGILGVVLLMVVLIWSCTESSGFVYNLLPTIFWDYFFVPTPWWHILIVMLACYPVSWVVVAVLGYMVYYPRFLMTTNRLRRLLRDPRYPNVIEVLEGETIRELDPNRRLVKRIRKFGRRS